MNTKNNKYKKRKFVKEDDDNDTIRKYTRNERRTFFYISITFSKVELWNSNKKDVKRLEYEEEEKEEEEGKTI